MNILYLCPDLGIPVLGRKGASVHVRELINAFARAGHRVTLAAQTLTRSGADPPAKVSARVIHVPPDSPSLLAAQSFREFSETVGVNDSLASELRRILYNKTFYRELKRRFLRRRPDFIYERMSLFGTAGSRLAAKLKVPHIVELNAPLALEQSTYRSANLPALAAEAERWTLTHADAVVVVSAELRRHALSLGVRPGNVHVMRNGVDPELFRPAPANPGSLRNGRLTLGFVGGLRPWHGVEILPDLLGRLTRRHPRVRLMIAGDGQLRGELERRFRQGGLTRRVAFSGALAHEQMPDVIRQFDVALAPYPPHDHDFYFSPLKLFEYMACGVPVVAADLGQISEVIAHGKTGLLYPAGSLPALVARCETLLRDARLRQTIGAAAARVVRRNYTWDHNAARVVRLATGLLRHVRR